MAERLRARRVGGGPSPLVIGLAVTIVVLLGVIVVFLLKSPLLNPPTATELARDEVLTALEAAPGDPGLLMTLAEVEYDLGREREAFDHAGQAVDNAGETLTIRMRYGMLLMRENRLEEARTALESEIEVDPDSAESYFLLGQVLREMGEFDAAIDALEHALVLQPINGDFRLVYAETLAASGNTDEAIYAYRSALEVLPNDERAVQGLADLGVSYEPTETPNPHGN